MPDENMEIFQEELAEMLGIPKDKLKAVELSSLKELLNKERKECNLENPTKYPSISIEEGNMFLDLFLKLQAKTYKEQKLDSIFTWVHYVFHVLDHTKEYPALFEAVKQTIHIKNRTTALNSALGLGMIIGLWLGRPDLVPMTEEFSGDGEGEDN